MWECGNAIVGLIGIVERGELRNRKGSLRDRRETAEGPPRGHGLIALEISVLRSWHGILCSWLVFSGFAKSTKKAQRRHIEGA